ncbi:MAG: D-alanyl-D-alanine carboxypeptidase family protein [Candidatus Krumholzibacteriia bacterium]
MTLVLFPSRRAGRSGPVHTHAGCRFTPTRCVRAALAATVVLLVALAGPPAVRAADAPEPAPIADAAAFEPQVLEGDFASAVVMDADTGALLAAYEPHARRQPASMTKMITELIVLEHAAEGRLSLADTVIVSARASRMGGSQVYLKHGELFTVEALLAALAVHSANDAAVALAEHVAGSVEAFVDLMNMRARELGLMETEFHTVHGLPAGRGQAPDLTSAWDMAVLGRALVQHERAREWASTATAPFRDGEFVMYNPNKLIGKYRGLDGIKTGYHSQAGFCVTASAVRRGKRLISVVMGASSDRARATETTRLLTYGFNLYEEVALVPGDGAVLDQPLRVTDGRQKDVSVGYAGALSVLVPKHRRQDLELRTELPETVRAPILPGQEVGRAVAYLDDTALGSVPVVTLDGVERGNWLDRLLR